MINLNVINLRKFHKEDLIQLILGGKFENPSVKDKKEIQRNIISSIESGAYVIAINALIIGVYFDYENTFQNIRKKGVFRYSKYVAKKCIVSNLASDLLELNKKHSFLTVSEKNYLTSIFNLKNLHTSFNEINIYLIDEIKKFEKRYKGKSLIKSLLVFADYLFLSNHYPKSNIDPMDIKCRSKEDLCSAISYLIYFITNREKLSPIDTIFVSEKFIKSKEICKIVIAACYLSDFKEFEVLVDSFGYECIQLKDKLKIIPPFEDFEKSIRIGYIKNQFQSVNDFNRAMELSEDSKRISLEELVDEMIKQEEFTFFNLTNTYGHPRYRLEIPEPIFELILERFIKSDLLFKEEVIYLAKVFKEQLLNPEDLNKIKVKDELTLMEFIKIRRLFLLLHLLFSKKVYEIEKLDSDILLRSLIPALNENDFYGYLGRLTPNENIDAFLDLICWKPGSDVLFDLQYRPVLFFNRHYLIPLSIFASSNSIRNLFASEYKQNNANLFTDGSIDALVEELQLSFNNAGIKSYKQTAIPNSDIDLFAVYDNTLFLFECKQSLEPVSAFDLRTTYDYIKKAENQLDYFNQLYEDGILLDLLEERLSINLSQISNVVSCIVLSNRMFNGNAFKYPVRNINEITNFIEVGTVRTNEGKFLLWENETLSLSDIINYLSLDSKFVGLFFDSLSVRTLVYKLTNPNIEFDSYYMDSKIAIPKLNEFTSKFKKVE